MAMKKYFTFSKARKLELYCQLFNVISRTLACSGVLPLGSDTIGTLNSWRCVIVITKLPESEGLKVSSEYSTPC